MRYRIKGFSKGKKDNFRLTSKFLLISEYVSYFCGSGAMFYKTVLSRINLWTDNRINVNTNRSIILLTLLRSDIGL